MSAQVVCPHCGKTIKLRDRSLLGQKGKCPGCAKSFLIQEQTFAEEVIPLQLVDEEPAVGTGAKWVPDDAVPFVAGEVPVAYVPVQTPQGVVLAPVMSGPIPGYPPAPLSPPIPAAVSAPPAGGFPVFQFDLEAVTAASTAESSATSSLNKRPARKSRGNNSVLIGLAVAMLAVIAGGLYLNSTSVPSASSKVVTADPTTNGETTTGGNMASSTTPLGAYSREALTLDTLKVAEFRPTTGKPIPLNMLTGTNNVLIHLWPGQIWGTEKHASKELKASLTQDVVNWLETTIKKITRRHPDQIEEILIGISVLSKVEPPQISTVFRLKTPEKRSALIVEFKGEEISMAGQPLVTKQDGFAFHIKDDRTIAICPAILGGDLSESVKKPLECVTDGIQELLKASDRERSFTLFVDVTDATTYSTQLFEPAVEPRLVKLLDWFGPEADTISWSLNAGQFLHSEIRVRPKGSRSGTGKVSTAETLKQDYEERWPKSVERVDTAMNPAAGEVPQVHFLDGSALNIDGCWKHSRRTLTAAEEAWLASVGWVLPTHR